MYVQENVSPLTVTVSATLSSELFVQSDRVAALVISGTQRWLTMALIGLVFPFILVSKKH